MKPQLTLVGGTSVDPAPAVTPMKPFVAETYTAKNEGGALPWVIRASKGRFVAAVLTESAAESAIEKLRAR